MRSSNMRIVIEDPFYEVCFGMISGGSFINYPVRLRTDQSSLLWQFNFPSITKQVRFLSMRKHALFIALNCGIFDESQREAYDGLSG